MGIRIPDELEPAEVGGAVTKAEYIKDGDETQHDINEKKLDDVSSEEYEEGKLYVRKNHAWVKLDISYDAETETLTIDTGSNNS